MLLRENNNGRAEYEAAMAESLRRDIVELYASIIAKTGLPQMERKRRRPEHTPHYLDRRRLAGKKMDKTAHMGENRNKRYSYFILKERKWRCEFLPLSSW